MANTPKVGFEINGKDNTKTAWDSARRQAQGATKEIKELITGAFAVLATGMLGEFFKASIEESMEAQRNFVDLSVALRNVGANANDVAPQVEQLVKTLAGKTGMDPDKMQAAMNRLIVQIGSYKGAMSTLPTVLDVAKARHIEMDQAVTLVSKAYQGNETALKKLGVAVHEGETPFDALRRTYKGFAEEEGKTFEGSLGRIHAKWKEVLQQTGDIITGNKDVADAGNWVSDSLSKMAVWIDHNHQAISDFVSVTVTVGKALAWVAGVAITAAVNSWRELEIIVIQATAGWYEIPEAAKLAFGELLDVFADFSIKANGFLNKLGIHIGDDVVKTLKSSATAMIQDASQEITRLQEAADNAVTKLYLPGKHETTNRNLPPGGASDTEGAASKKAIEEAQKAQMAAWKAELDNDKLRDAALKAISAELAKQEAIIANTQAGTLAYNKAVAQADALKKLLQSDEQAHFQKELDADKARLMLTDQRAATLEKLRSEAIAQLAIANNTANAEERRLLALKRYKDLMAAGGFKTDDELSHMGEHGKVTTSNPTKPREKLPDSFGAGLADSIKSFDTLDELIGGTINSVGKLGGAIGGLTGGALKQFGSTMASTLLNAIKGHENLGKAIVNSMKAAVAGEAMSRGQLSFIKATEALAEGLFGNPEAFAAAAEFAAAGAAYVGLAAALGAGGSAGGPSGGGGAASGVGATDFQKGQAQTAPMQGTTTIAVQGSYWPNDPRFLDQLAQAIGAAKDQRIILTSDY